MTRSLVVAVLLSLCAPASTLVAHGAMRLMTPSRAPVSAAPQMLLGGAGRSAMRFVRRCKPIVPRIPGNGGGVGGNTGGSGGNGGVRGRDTSMSADDGDDPKQGLSLWLKQYDAFVDESPILAKALTSLVGFMLGDILAQLFIQKTDTFDYARLLRLSSFGFFVHGTTSHWFYGLLDGKLPGTTAKIVFTKVAIDQLLWNPCFGVMFFTYQAGFELKGLGYVAEKVRTELLTQVTGSWRVWPLAHAINFRFIPSSQRVLYINSIQIGYNCFLSLISNRRGEKAK